MKLLVVYADTEHNSATVEIEEHESLMSALKERISVEYSNMPDFVDEVLGEVEKNGYFHSDELDIDIEKGLSCFGTDFMIYQCWTDDIFDRWNEKYIVLPD
jgi:hypothetical protein